MYSRNLQSAVYVPSRLWLWKPTPIHLLREKVNDKRNDADSVKNPSFLDRNYTVFQQTGFPLCRIYLTETFPVINHQCCGSMTFWCESGSESVDRCLWLRDPDSDPVPAPAFWPSRCQQKLIFVFHFYQGFSYYFCVMIKGSGSGSIPLTNGSGSGRPKTCGSGGFGFGSGSAILN